MAKVYRLGTRGSLLAVTQSTLIKNELESLGPDRFELIKIETQGDQETEKPLWQMEGKDFFTKELDQALLSGKVDLVIHSYKDLGSIRPEGLRLAALTKRSFPYDLLLLKKDQRQQLSQAPTVRVGTSSPRRQVNLTRHLPSFLSWQGKVECSTLRGNINTRIQKLQRGDYDAIVLAMAGLERLALGRDSRSQLKDLCQGLDFCILPASVFPPAASQGVLAIEMAPEREETKELYSLVRKIHDVSTEKQVRLERERFAQWGGGCHLAVGIFVRPFQGSQILIERGEVDGVLVDAQKILPEPKISFDPTLPSFIGLPPQKKWKSGPHLLWDEILKKIPLSPALPQGHSFFVTSNYGLENLSSAKPSTLWSSGARTHRWLTAQGLWAQGSADSFGHDEIQYLQSSQFVQTLLPPTPLHVLSHQEASSPLGPVIGTYRHEWGEISDSFTQRMMQIEQFYWTSERQFSAYLKAFPFIKDKKHFCGLGKTFTQISALNIHPIPLPMSTLRSYDLTHGK